MKQNTHHGVGVWHVNKPNYMQILNLHKGPCKSLRAQTRTLELVWKIGGSTIGRERCSLEESADISSANLLYCDLNLRTETWPDLTRTGRQHLGMKGPHNVKSPKGNRYVKSVVSHWNLQVTVHLLCFYVTKENEFFCVFFSSLFSGICCVLQWWRVNPVQKMLLCVSSSGALPFNSKIFQKEILWLSHHYLTAALSWMLNL